MSKQFVTESVMADAFGECLRSGVFASFPSFDSVYREVVCQQGIADFITTVNIRSQAPNIDKIDSLQRASETSIRILSLLKRASPRSMEHLIKKSGLTDQTVMRALSHLMADGMITKTDSGNYLLSNAWYMHPVQLWAFELKLTDWRRALFQALQCKAFATCVVTVFPMERRKLLELHLDKFRTMRVGVMLFDTYTHDYHVLLRPLKSRPASHMHYLYAFSQIASMSIQELSNP